MIAIVLKDSTYNRVTTRLRHFGDLAIFSSLPSRVFHDGGFTYMYFQSLSDLCYSTDFLSSLNAVYRVVEIKIHRVKDKRSSEGRRRRELRRRKKGDNPFER